MKLLMPYEGRGRFGKWLAYRIFTLGFTVDEFSNDIGMSRRSVLNHIHMRNRPTLENVKKYCKYFGEDDLWSIYDVIIDDWRNVYM